MATPGGWALGGLERISAGLPPCWEVEEGCRAERASSLPGATQKAGGGGPAHPQLIVGSRVRWGVGVGGPAGLEAGARGEARSAGDQTQGEFQWAFSEGEVTTSSSSGLPEPQAPLSQRWSRRGVAAGWGPGQGAKCQIGRAHV